MLCIDTSGLTAIVGYKTPYSRTISHPLLNSFDTILAYLSYGFFTSATRNDS